MNTWNSTPAAKPLTQDETTALFAEQARKRALGICVADGCETLFEGRQLSRCLAHGGVYAAPAARHRARQFAGWHD